MRLSQGLPRIGTRRGLAPVIPLTVVQNGRFDVNTMYWGTGDATIAAVAGGYNGTCLQITNTGAATGRASQQLSIPAGTYELHLFQKTGTGTGYVSVSQDAGGDDLVNASLNYGAWTEYIATFTCAFDYPWLNLWVDSTTPGQYVLFDEVVVAATPTAGSRNDGAMDDVIEDVL